MRPILHVGAWGRNWGDQAIALGARHAAGPGHEWLPLDCQVERFTVERVRELEAQAGPDGVWLIGGGGLIWAKPELDSPSGWQWQIEQDALEAIRLPIVVWAVGSPTFPHGDRTWDESAPWADALRDSLELLQAKASTFAVRDSSTVELFGANYLVPPDLVVPDMAWALAGKLRRTYQMSRVGLVWAEDKADWRWDGKEGEVRLAIERELKGEQVRVIPHLSDEHCEGWPALWERAPLHGQPDLQLVPDWAEMTYEGLDIVISARKHGIVLAAAQGVPAYGIGDVVEVRQMCDEVGAPYMPTALMLKHPGLLRYIIEGTRKHAGRQYARAIEAGERTSSGLRTALANARGTGG